MLCMWSTILHAVSEEFSQGSVVAKLFRYGGKVHNFFYFKLFPVFQNIRGAFFETQCSNNSVLTVGNMAQWLGRRSLAGGFPLIYA